MYVFLFFSTYSNLMSSKGTFDLHVNFESHQKLRYIYFQPFFLRIHHSIHKLNAPLVGSISTLFVGCNS